MLTHIGPILFRPNEHLRWRRWFWLMCRARAGISAASPSQNVGQLCPVLRRRRHLPVGFSEISCSSSTNASAFRTSELWYFYCGVVVVHREFPDVVGASDYARYATVPLLREQYAIILRELEKCSMPMSGPVAREANTCGPVSFMVFLATATAQPQRSPLLALAHIQFQSQVHETRNTTATFTRHHETAAAYEAANGGSPLPVSRVIYERRFAHFRISDGRCGDVAFCHRGHIERRAAPGPDRPLGPRKACSSCSPSNEGYWIWRSARVGHASSRRRKAGPSRSRPSSPAASSPRVRPSPNGRAPHFECVCLGSTPSGRSAFIRMMRHETMRPLRRLPR